MRTKLQGNGPPLLQTRHALEGLPPPKRQAMMPSIQLGDALLRFAEALYSVITASSPS